VTPAQEEALRDTQRAFDGVAPTYDRANARNPVLREIRRRTVSAVAERVPAGSSLLDLGCGPGLDAEHFARMDYRVVAVDWSARMVGETARRIEAAGLQDRVEVFHLGIHELERLAPRVFDAAYSDLGPLNCVPDLEDAALRIAQRIAPGGIFAASVIGRLCPWELALYGARRNWKRLRVRFSPDLVPVPLDGGTVWTRYYSPAELEGAFRPAGFERLSLRALGLFLPPPYLEGFQSRHPRWLELLSRIEDRVASRPILRGWGDHFLIVMRRTPA
jgi:SAM-dependent methyltransferase